MRTAEVGTAAVSEGDVRISNYTSDGGWRWYGRGRGRISKYARGRVCCVDKVDLTGVLSFRRCEMVVVVLSNVAEDKVHRPR